MKLFNILQKCHNSIFILHCFISTSKKSAPDIMQKKKETNKQRKITIKPWLCIFRRNHFMHCSLSRYWSCSSWRAEVHCTWWSYSSFNFILTTRETCTWARMWISSGVSRKWNIGCGVTKLPIEWPNLFTTQSKGISSLPFSCFRKFTRCKFNEIQISPKEDMKSTSLSSIIKAKYQLHRYGTEKEKIEYNYLCFRSKNLPCLKFYFLFPGNGKDLKTSSIQKKTKETWQNMYLVPEMLWHRLYADEGTFSFCGAEIGSKSIFERRATIGSGSTFFSFLYTSKLTNLSLLSVFTLIIRHDLPENLGKTTAQE